MDLRPMRESWESSLLTSVLLCYFHFICNPSQALAEVRFSPPLSWEDLAEERDPMNHSNFTENLLEQNAVTSVTSG